MAPTRGSQNSVIAGERPAVIMRRRTQLFHRTPGQHDLKPFPLDGSQVVHQAAECGLRRNMPLTDLLIGQAGQLALHDVPVKIKEGLQHLAFPLVLTSSSGASGGTGPGALMRERYRRAAVVGRLARYVAPGVPTSPTAAGP
jgi:hypothetical protein